VEEIARLPGHANSRVTETVYRHELRPVITTGAEVMGQDLHDQGQLGQYPAARSGKIALQISAGEAHVWGI
jgi:hypothetical protein